MSTNPTPSTPTSTAVSLSRLVCGVDGSRLAGIAVEQLVLLADPGATVELIAVTDERGSGPSAMATLSGSHAQEAIDAARRTVLEAGAAASGEVVHDADPAAVLADRARDADLLAIGAPVGSRAAGIFLGATASRLLHRSPVPVLVARRPPSDDEGFPARLIVATDGSPGSDRAVAIAARLAARRNSRVSVLHAGPEAREEQRRRIAEQTVALQEATGTEPVRLDPAGDAADAIVTAAKTYGADLVVLGSRGLTGARALGSVGERVAHRAPCSVLVARG